MSQTILISYLTEEKSYQDIPYMPIKESNWGGDYFPKIYGKLAYIKNIGFRVSFQCHESTPSCQYTNDFDPVYFDSAVEFFLQFPDYSNSYFNLEMNTSTAMIAAIGPNKEDRINIPLDELSTIKRTVTWMNQHTLWQADIVLPAYIIEKYIGLASKKIVPGLPFRFQLYKLVERGIQTHFLSLGPIISPTPNFHLPEYFLTGILS